MSPTCMIKPKQFIDQHKSKSKYSKTKQKHKLEESIKTSQSNDENINIELSTKCSCPQSRFNDDHASIQFSRRYLQCQSSMPIGILRSYIEQILPHSSMTQVSLYDSNDRLLKDSDLLQSLKTSLRSSSHIPIYFTLFNTITSFGHCLCSSSSIEEKSSSSSSFPRIIKRETIDRTLSTFSRTGLFSSCSSSPIESSNSISIVNLLTPPPSSSNSPFLIDNQSIIDEITSQFGEICPPLPKKPRYRLPKKLTTNIPLDLSLKKRPSSFDLLSSQPKWIKT